MLEIRSMLLEVDICLVQGEIGAKPAGSYTRDPVQLAASFQQFPAEREGGERERQPTGGTNPRHLLWAARNQ